MSVNPQDILIHPGLRNREDVPVAGLQIKGSVFNFICLKINNIIVLNSVSSRYFYELSAAMCSHVKLLKITEKV